MQAASNKNRRSFNHWSAAKLSEIRHVLFPLNISIKGISFIQGKILRRIILLTTTSPFPELITLLNCLEEKDREYEHEISKTKRATL